jgi:hypothetical protein
VLLSVVIPVTTARAPSARWSRRRPDALSGRALQIVLVDTAASTRAMKRAAPERAPRGRGHVRDARPQLRRHNAVGPASARPGECRDHGRRFQNPPEEVERPHASTIATTSLHLLPVSITRLRNPAAGSTIAWPPSCCAAASLSRASSA